MSQGCCGYPSAWVVAEIELEDSFDGTFQPGTFYPVGRDGEYVGVGDFNGDGEPDLALADNRFDYVFVLLNTGVASFSPTDPLLFPSQFVGTMSATQKVVLTNSGTAELSISSMTASGPFQANSDCGGTVAPGTSCDIGVTFKPETTGRAAGLVTIIDSASSKPQVIEVFGVGTELEMSPQSLTFPAQKVGTTSPPMALKMTNHGSAAFPLTTFALRAITQPASASATIAARDCLPERVVRSRCDSRRTKLARAAHRSM
jgi:Abnormal spindle-like microcephaly-assoc'd, ASPM-SPD-2-Hydin